jgi:uncharacterized membrane-anchored protein
MSRERLLILIVAVQVLLLAGWAVKEEIHLIEGQEILLETEPIDPRDILRGDYIILNYKISRIPRELVADEKDENLWGKKIYVFLEPRGKFHQIQAASRTKPGKQQRELFLKGTLGWEGTVDGQEMVHVDYGIERYFVPEGKGIVPDGELTVKISRLEDGRARVKELLIDGKPYP